MGSTPREYRGDRRGTPVAGAAATSESAPTTRVRPVVVKLGGRSLEATGAPRELAVELARLSARFVLVHGGASEVSQWSKRLALEPKFVDGLRVTDGPTLEVVAAVLAGLANKRWVARLQDCGVDAVGLAAMDGGLTTVAPHARAAELGEVGQVRSVNADLLSTLLALGHTPVLSSIGAYQGRLLNLNADDLASAVAVALASPLLIYLTDAPGVRLDGRVVPRLEASELPRTLARAEVEGGMRPKLLSAGTALAGGVERAVIAKWEGPGTLAAILNESEEGPTRGTTLVASSAADQPAHSGASD